MADRNTLGHNRYRMYVSANGGSTWTPFSGAGAGGTSSNFAAAFPGAGSAVGFLDSTGLVMSPGNLDAGGNLKVAGTISVSPTAAGTSGLTNVALTGATQQVLAANANRLSLIIYNDSVNGVYIKLGTTASATSFTKRILPNEYFSTSDLGVNYTGRVDALADAGSGSLRVTELSA